MTAPFISVSDLALGIDEPVTNTDLAAVALDSACELVRGYLDRHLNLVADDEVLVDGSGRDALALPEFPVVTVADTVVVDGTSVAASSYVLDRASGILYTSEVGHTWPKGRRNIAVTYTHGYAPSEDLVDVPGHIFRVPSDIRSVALDVARRLFVNAGVADGSSSAVRDAIGGSEEWTPYSVPMALQPEEEFRLDPHRVRKAG